VRYRFCSILRECVFVWVKYGIYSHSTWLNATYFHEPRTFLLNLLLKEKLLQIYPLACYATAIVQRVKIYWLFIDAWRSIHIKCVYVCVCVRACFGFFFYYFIIIFFNFIWYFQEKYRVIIVKQVWKFICLLH
jgi:hypothetical protein